MIWNGRVCYSLLIVVILLSACQPLSGEVLPDEGTSPLPKTVADAVLVNFRPLTDDGRSIGPVWSPDGQNLAYTQLSFAPRMASYQDANSQPKTEVWEASVKGKDGQFVDLGIALFYSKDGSQIYYQVYDPSDNTPSVYAINSATRKTRHFLGTQGFPSVTALADGRLVLSELGTSAPLRILDPSNGERRAIMAEHPSKTPQNARLSPDGKRLAYSKDKELYISNQDGSSARLVSNYGSGPAIPWWSPDSKVLAYTTGSSQADRLVLADRQGNTKATLFQNLADIGVISSIAWSPDSRWLLVTAESFKEYAQPSRTYLFDQKGNHQLLLESFIAASPAWSPDGRTIALSLWIGPQSTDPVFDIWLADLTDTTAANLPKSSLPQPKPTPTLATIPSDSSAEQVVRSFWESVQQKDYNTAWSMLTPPSRVAQKFPEFRAFYECFLDVSITDLKSVKGDQDTQIFSVKIDFQSDPQCNANWQQSKDFYAILVKQPVTEPWQIECFSNSPSCMYQER